MKSVTRTPWKSWSWVRRKDTDKVCPSVVVSQLEVKIRTVGGAVYGTFCFGFPWRHPPKRTRCYRHGRCEHRATLLLSQEFRKGQSIFCKRQIILCRMSTRQNNTHTVMLPTGEMGRHHVTRLLLRECRNGRKLIAHFILFDRTLGECHHCPFICLDQVKVALQPPVWA
jgi:hypothetical protein